MARVARLRIHPVKSLDAVEVEAASITSGGTLDGD
nr:molybdenum cofactor biosysynthesis protein [Actinomycetota bacterium]NIT94640.1 molybdenum cofactor biosysynthesis protein [Actinomycetota bacterium]NIU18250.1 molybdenum cofactor biosysynthesis protein [Actinomycetota bacterium]NIU64947.1 molybdenum cofactor biosysynthesis protein [Actinomycetota bacterium]NIV54740.1 molybdenum cofactor biosysynthesis protein [Actinomycetota bacterium]